MATVFEAYDTPMLDYHSDMDVQMHPNSDLWFTEETNMEAEDTHLPLTRSSSDGDLVDVEIEMENYPDEDWQNPEYEMTDEAEAVNPSTALEPDDILVIDASQQPSTLQDSTPDSLSIPGLTSQSLDPSAKEVAAGPIDTETFVAREPELPSIETVMHSSESSSKDAVQENDSSEPKLPLSTAVFGEAVVSESLSAYVLLEEPSTHVEEDVPEAKHVSTAGTDTAVASDVADSWSKAAIDPADAEDSVQTEGEAIHNPSLVEEGGVELTETEVDARALDNSESIITNLADSIEHPVDPVENEENRASEKDPHEISEGVFIDPPPTVLLSFAFSDRPDVCLFNQLSQSDPSSSTTEPSVLLSEQPTLYYEPLSTVFEALRNSSELASLSDLSQGELVLDAYDLELTVSEDNIFARETSLHDLNVLHDGLDFTGALRLRLQLVNPRFLTRYRMLQEQVMRLNLAEIGEEYTTDELNESSLQESTEQEHGPGYTEENRTEYQEQDEERLNEIYQQDEEQTENEAGELQLDSSNETDVHNNESAVPEDDQYTQHTEDLETAEGALFDDATGHEEEYQEYNGESNVEEPAEFTFVDDNEAYEEPDDAQEPERTFEERKDQQFVRTDGEDEDGATQIQEGLPQIPAQSHERDLDDPSNNDLGTSTVPEAASESYLTKPPKDAESYEADEFYYDATADAEWDDSEYEDILDNSHGADTTIDTEADGENESASVQSSITLSSRHSKRSIHDLDEDQGNNTVGPVTVQSSPGAKRVRTE